MNGRARPCPEGAAHSSGGGGTDGPNPADPSAQGFCNRMFDRSPETPLRVRAGGGGRVARGPYAPRRKPSLLSPARLDISEEDRIGRRANAGKIADESGIP